MPVEDNLLANIAALEGGWGRLPGECSYSRRQRRANSKKGQVMETPQSMSDLLRALEGTVARKENAIDRGWRWYLPEIEAEISDHFADIHKLRSVLEKGFNNVPNGR